MSPQSPLIVPVKKVVTHSGAIVPTGKVVANSGGRECAGALRPKEETAMTANWNELMEEHEIAYLRADICLGSPQSYSLDEKKRICEDMDASTKAVDAAMRADFWSMSAEARSRMLDMLGAPGVEERHWWEELLGVSQSKAAPINPR